MNIIVELTKSKITISIGDATTEIPVGSTFYQKAKGQNAYQFFIDKKTNGRIRDFIFYHRNKLSFFEKLKYLILRNNVELAVDEYVRRQLPDDVIHAYLTLACDAREVAIVSS
ncbi:MAG TPA: hypothetical protein VD927_05605 [Chryseosolibacter sp.]|nr:hypothetical protein [Chryseosolibacter sp.]